MEHDDLREILERLEALERLARSRSRDRGERDERRRGDRDRHDQGHHDHDHHDHGQGRGDDGFDEKRIIDTVVRLVGERVERFMQDQQARMRPRDAGGEERRVVDLVVRLVSEHVQEIVQQILSTELDRRFGRPGEERRAENAPPGESSGPEQR